MSEAGETLRQAARVQRLVAPCPILVTLLHTPSHLCTASSAIC